MAIYYPQEIHFAEEGQTDLVLETPYLVGSNELMVFLNGMLVVLDSDYTEIDEVTLRFSFQLSNADVIIVQRKVATDGIKYTIIGKSDSLFKMMGTEDTLMPNQTYALTFAQHGQEFSHSFQTIIDPLYSTIQIIRNDLGDTVENITDQRLLFLMYQNSILAENIASEENMTLLNDSEKTPYMFKQYVRYQTEMDLMTAIHLYVSGNSGQATKILGEMEITRRLELGQGFKDTLADLKGKLRKWERILTGVAQISPVLSAVKGGTANPYPLTSPRMTNGTGRVEG